MLGTPVNFAFTGTDGIAASEFTGKILLQSAEYSKAADEEQVRNAAGALVTRHFYNEHEKATLEYVPTGASIATALTNTAVSAVGTIVNITACANLPALVNTHWVIVGEPKITGSNTTAKKISLSLEAHTNITAAAS